MKLLLVIVGCFILSLSLFSGNWGKDPFQPPEGVKEVAPPHPVVKESPPPNLTLSGTLIAPEGAIAIINEKILKEGENIGGFRVLRIERKKVILEKEGKHYTLQLGMKKEIVEKKGK